MIKKYSKQMLDFKEDENVRLDPHIQLNKILKILSVLHVYLKIHWASIVHVKRKNLVLVYSENTPLSDVKKNIETVDIFFKYDNLQRCESYIKNPGNIFVYSKINNQYSLIVKFPLDTPLAPAEAMCEYVSFLISQLMKTKYTYYETI